MGCCLPCFGGYREIPHSDVSTVEYQRPYIASARSEDSSVNTAFHLVPSAREEQEDIQEFNLESPVFKGTNVEQKFSNKSTYEQRFVWINLETRTLNLSEYKVKEKRHKEASLGDVINIVAGPPEKFKAPVDKSGNAVKLNIDTCMSVTFIRGGGIDLKFKSEAERDAWYSTLTKIMSQRRAIENVPSAGERK